MISKLHRLPLKLAGAAAGAVFVLGTAGWIAGGVVLWWGLLAVVFTGAIVYAVAHRWVARRVERADAVLRKIQRQQFEAIDAARLPEGDEMSDLLWQVYRTGQAMEGELHELKKTESYRRDFIGDVSHELKTPTFAIQGFAETLLDGALADEDVRRSFVEKILRNADRMNQLARDLAEIARLETGELQMTVRPFDLAHLVREVSESLELSAQAKDITLRYDVPADVPRVRGDRDRLRQVLTNLVDNAIKYTNPGGHVEIAAQLRADGTVEVAVVDDGVGITEEHIGRLTERFYRVDRGRSRSQGGTGLGLSIVKHILGAHGTQLMIDSVPGQGSTFRFALPVGVEEREYGKRSG